MAHKSIPNNKINKDENNKIRTPGANDNIFGTNIVEAINDYSTAIVSALSSALFGQPKKKYNELVTLAANKKISLLDEIDQFSKKIPEILKKKDSKVTENPDGTRNIIFEKLNSIISQLSGVTNKSDSVISTYPYQNNKEEAEDTATIKESIEAIANGVKESIPDIGELSVSGTIESNVEDIKKILSLLYNEVTTAIKNFNITPLLESIAENISNISTLNKEIPITFTLENPEDLDTLFNSIKDISKTDIKGLDTLLTSLTKINRIKVEGLSNVIDSLALVESIDFRKLNKSLNSIDKDSITNFVNTVNELSTIKSIRNLKSIEDIEQIYNILTNIGDERALRRTQRAFSLLQEILVDKDSQESMINLISDLNNLSKALIKSRQTVESISELVNFISIIGNTNFVEAKNNIGSINDTIQLLITEISKLSLDESFDAEAQLEPITNILDVIETKLFLRLDSLADEVDKANGDIDKIQSVMERTKTLALSARSIDEDDLVEADEASNNIIASIALLGTVMLIGGLIFIANGRILLASLKFGATLGLFLMELMIPIALLGVVARYIQKGATTDWLPEVTNFVKGAAAVLTLCSLVFLIRNIDLAAIGFAKIFFQFLLAIELPIILLSRLAKGHFLDDLDYVSNFIVKASLVLTLGAMIMLYKNGLIYKNSFSFAKYLAIFIGITLLPFAIYSRLVKNSISDAEEIAHLIVVSTGIMMIGSLFVTAGGGRYAKQSLLFGVYLGGFLLLTLLPFRLFKNFKEDLGDTINAIRKLVISSALIMMLGALFVQNRRLVEGAKKFTKLLFFFLVGVCAPFWFFGIIATKMATTLKAVLLFVISATALLLVGSFVFVKRPEMVLGAIAFTVLLDFFIRGILKPFKKLNLKEIASCTAVMTSLSILLISSAIAMGLSAIIVDKYGWNALAGAGLLLGTIYILMHLVRELGDYKKQKMLERGAKNALLLSGVLIALSITMWIINKVIPDPLQTGIKVGMTLIVLGALVGMTIWLGKSNIRKDALNSIKNVALLSLVLISISGAFFILGHSKVEWKHFLILSAMFALTIATVYLIKWIDKNLDTKTMQGAIKTIGMLSLCLIAISISLSIIGKSGVTWKEFGILACMLGVVVLASYFMLWLSKSVKKSDVTEALIIVGMLSICLLAISKALTIIADSGADWKHVLMLGAMCGIVVVMSVLVLLLSKIKTTNAVKGAAVLGICTLIIYGLAQSVKVIADSGADWKHIGMLGVMSAIVVALGLLMIGVGTLATNPLVLAAIAVGGAVIGGITLIIMGLASALKTVAEAVEIMEKIKNPERIGEVLNSVLNTFNSIDLKNSKKLVKDSRALKKALKALVPPLSLAAQLVQDISNMKVATGYDEKGKATGYRQLKASDFKKASEGISTILTTLANGIMLASQSIDQISSRKIFKRTLSFGHEVGPLISEIASSLKKYANLVFPVYDQSTGKVIGYEKFNDFGKAAQNIALVITTLGGTIARIAKGGSDKVQIGDSYITYDEFSDAITGKDKKFQKVLDASFELGKVITTITKGLIAYASGKIPLYGEDGKQMGYQLLRDIDPQKVAQSVGLVLTTLFASIVSVYDTYPEYFDKEIIGTGIFGIVKKQAPSKLELALSSSVMLGDVLSKLSKGLVAMAELRFPEYGPDGKIVSYTTITDTDLTNVGQNIKKVLIAVAEGVSKAYDEITKTNLLVDAQQKISAMAPLGNLIKDMADGLVMYSKLIIPQFDSNGKPIAGTVMKDSDFVNAAKNISIILATVTKSIIRIFQDDRGKTIVKPDKLKLMIEAISGVTNIIKTSAEAITIFAEGGIPVYKDGKIVDRIPFSTEDIDKFKELTQKTVLAGFEILQEVQTQHQDLLKMDLEGLLETILKPMDLIRKSADLIKSIASYTIPVYENGKAVSSIPLDITKIESTASIIEKLVTAVPNALISSLGALKSSDVEDYETLEAIVESANSLIESLNSGLLQKLSKELVIPENIFTAKRLSQAPANESEEISSMPPVLIDIYYVTSGMYKLYKLLNELNITKLGNKLNVLNSLIPDLEYKIEFIIDGANTVSSIFDKIDQKYLTNIVNGKYAVDLFGIVVFYNSLVSIINKVNDKEILFPKSLQDNTQIICDTLSILSVFLTDVSKHELEEELVRSTLDKLDLINLVILTIEDNIYKIHDGFRYANYSKDIATIKLFDKYIKSIFETVNDLVAISSPIDVSVFDTTILPVISKTGNMIEALNKVFNSEPEEKGKSYFGKLRNMVGDKLDFKSIEEKVNAFSNAMVTLTKMSLIAAGASSDGFDIIAQGYEDINNKIDKFSNENNSKFSEHAKILSRYVKTVNSLDENKLYKLNELLETMNKLSKNLGNIDKFTEVLAKKLSETLKELTDNINSAEKTIARADEMQKKRAEAIDESIKKVNEIMDKPLRIGVKNIGDDETVESVWENPKDKGQL